MEKLTEKEQKLFASILKNPFSIENLSEEEINENREIIYIAFNLNPDVLPHIPKKFIEPEMLYFAVYTNGLLLPYILENFELNHLQKYFLCLDAIKQNPSVWELVPENIKTDEMYRQAQFKKEKLVFKMKI